MKITFKRGNEATAAGKAIKIKIGGKEVGAILPPTTRRNPKWSVSVAVEKANPVEGENSWYWWEFVVRHNTEEEAKDWCLKTLPEWAKSRTFHYFID